MIKFTGRYDQEWIRELKTFGKLWFDKVTHEWLLRWSQLAVDSLSDYFSSRGVEVIVKKKEIPVIMAEIRNEQGNEIFGIRVSGTDMRLICMREDWI